MRSISPAWWERGATRKRSNWATAGATSIVLVSCFDVPPTQVPWATDDPGAAVEPGAEQASGGTSHEGEGDPAPEGAGGGAASGNGSGNGGDDPPSSTSSGGGSATPSGLPCEIDAVLAARCRACHSAPPRGGAPMPLLSYADLTAPARSDAGTAVAVLAVARMQSSDAPMPPGSMPSVPASEVELLQAWIDAGLPMGDCGGGEEPGTAGASGMNPEDPPPPAEVICTSGKHWDPEDDDNNGGLDEEGPWMNPGRACITCHLEEEDEPILQIGGTVFPTFHEEDLCYGVDGTSSDAHVVITDAEGTTFTLPLERTGNFSLRARDDDDDDDDDSDEAVAQVRFPIRAKVVAGGRERMMMTPQNTGDCNSCHTEQGRNGAPGRILLP